MLGVLSKRGRTCLAHISAVYAFLEEDVVHACVSVRVIGMSAIWPNDPIAVCPAPAAERLAVISSWVRIGCLCHDVMLLSSR